MQSEITPVLLEGLLKNDFLFSFPCQKARDFYLLNYMNDNILRSVVAQYSYYKYKKEIKAQIR